LPKPLCDTDVFAAATIGEAMLRYQGNSALNQPMLQLVASLAAIQSRAYGMLGSGLPPGSERASPPEHAWLTSVIDSVVAALADQAPNSQGLSEVGQHLANLDFEFLMAAARHEEEAVDRLLTGAAQAGVHCEAATILYVVKTALQPYLAWRFASLPALGEMSAYPPRRDCPACGGKPMMAKHAHEDGRRYLRCGVCGHEWPFPRLLCISCEAGDPSSIEVVYSQDDQGRRLYLCAACRRYFKVSDERMLEGCVYLPLEDIATVQLDELARQQGYVPVADSDLQSRGTGSSN